MRLLFSCSERCTVSCAKIMVELFGSQIHLDVLSLMPLRIIFFLSFALGEITLVGEDT